MRILAAALLAALALFAGAGGRAEAGVIGSPHDIAAHKYTVLGREEEKKNVCNYCHVPHKAKGARLWATQPPSLKGWGKVGPLCYSCHDGVAIVSPNVDASMTAFNPKSHGLDKDDLPQGDDMSGSDLPYTQGQSDQDHIECSTCHNPHDDTNRPFLRAPIVALCTKCHKNRENSGYNLNNQEGTHPVHKEPVDEVEGGSPIDVQADFKVAFPLEYPAENGKYAEGVHWTLGGHLSEGEKGTIECITCHSVHGKEGVGPPCETLLSSDPVKKDADLFCEGCHRGVRADEKASPPFPNPGATTASRTYHPADDDVCNGIGRKVEINAPAGWVFGQGGEVLCTTCHRAHRALKNSPILNPPVTSKTFCEECHSTPFAHHPSGQFGKPDLTTGKGHKETRDIIIPQSFPAGITYGEPQPNALYCSSCHRAHNANCPPILVVPCQNSCDICVQCHSKYNPTWQTDDNYKSSHFVGDPTAPEIDSVTVNEQVFGTQKGYYDQYPPLYRDVWPESGLKSIYGGPQGNSVTCCSCHSFDVGSLTGGDADRSPYLGPLLAPNYQEQDLTAGLLARAGSFKEWLESDIYDLVIGGKRGTEKRVNKYLCTGCHGLTPNTHPGEADEGGGEGLTHPLMEADGSKFQPELPAKLTYNQHVNCESCHSPHEADSRGGYFILRETWSRLSNTTSGGELQPWRIMKRSEIEYAPLCERCHIGY